MNAVYWSILFADKNIVVPPFENYRKTDVCTRAKTSFFDVGENPTGNEKQFGIKPGENLSFSLYPAHKLTGFIGGKDIDIVDVFTRK
mmetsp:Transcript_1579/g.2178  ORF Transcript_1579/g.2178 Transcript_1579/m.2178 type:complete len:87 (-) Transcript_1579:326-586(-)